MSRDVDNPEKQAAERRYAGTARKPSRRTTQPERVKLPYEDLLELQDKISEDWRKVTDGVRSTASVIKDLVLERAQRLAKLDLDVFPEVTVVVGDGTESTVRLLEVPGSGRARNYSFDASSYKFSALVDYITPEGDIAVYSATPQRKGGRVVYAAPDRGSFLASAENVVNNRQGIFDALQNAAYRGVITPKNHRPAPAAEK